MKDRLKAMHQGMSPILFFFFLPFCFVSALIVYVVKHGWSPVLDLRRGFEDVHQCLEWPCYCLIATPWFFFFFPYHFLHSILRFQAWVNGSLPTRCVRPQGKPFLLYYSTDDLSQMFNVRSLLCYMTLS